MVYEIGKSSSLAVVDIYFTKYYYYYFLSLLLKFIYFCGEMSVFCMKVFCILSGGTDSVGLSG